MTSVMNDGSHYALCHCQKLRVAVCTLAEGHDRMAEEWTNSQLNLPVVMATFRNHSQHGATKFDAGRAVWVPQACTFVAATSMEAKYT